MKIFLTAITLYWLATTCYGQSLTWEQYIEKFGITFGDSNKADIAKKVYLSNIDSILKHNQVYKEGKQTYEIGVNQFTHLTYDEFIKQSTGLIESDLKNVNDSLKPEIDGRYKRQTLPASVDWVASGLVTPVKNQGRCGSCWAFSAVAALESQWKRVFGQLYDLSEQQVNDCTYPRPRDGCNGGWPHEAFTYMIGGVQSEATYLYTSGTSGTSGPCRYNPALAIARDCGRNLYWGGNEAHLMNLVANIGPISIGIYVSRNFQLYRTGIFTDATYIPSTRIHHAVLLVGYGTLNGRPYWLIKNSWGTSWGEAGYMRIARNVGSIYGMNNLAYYYSYPIVNPSCIPSSTTTTTTTKTTPTKPTSCCPCLNRGRCVSVSGQCKCSCPRCFTGPLCETRLRCIIPSIDSIKPINACICGSEFEFAEREIDFESL